MPRIFITEDEEEKNEDTPKQSEENLLGESRSFLEMLKELKEHEEKPLKSRSRCSSVLSCFEIVDPQPSSPFMFEDERELLKNFEICHKPKHSKSFAQGKTPIHGMPEPVNKSKSKVSSESSVVSEKLKVDQPKIVEFGFRDVSTSPITDSLKGNFSQAGELSSHDNFITKRSAISEQSNSVDELFFNRVPFEDSDTAHFTSLTVSSNESTPCNSPPQKTVPSSGHRVKFVASVACDRILPQNEPLTIFQVENSDSSTSVASDKTRKISRLPVCCPITTCDTSTVPSDFCNHITIDHPYIPYLKIAPGKNLNTTISQRGNPNMIICQRLFLLTGKVNDIGYGAFENCLPVLLLTCKMTMSKAFGCSLEDSETRKENFFVFLVGVYQLPVDFTITLWSHGRDDTEPVFIKCMSNSVLLINKPTSLKEIAKNSLALSPKELQKLSSSEKKALSCQIIFH